MAQNNLIDVRCFGLEIGRLGLDPNQKKSYFQFHPQFLETEKFSQLFPQTGILKRVEQVQVFSEFFNSTFHGLPPMFADSLPDAFGNIIFQKWLEVEGRSLTEISPLEQLAYVGRRGMGALEYYPAKEISPGNSIDLSSIIKILEEVLHSKTSVHAPRLNHTSLLNIFKMGTSAGGARPKLLIAENKENGVIYPGDFHFGEDFNHYLVKLSLESNQDYKPELIEYTYYLLAKDLGIRMMPSKLIDEKHFATLRFDRQNGKKKHILTASGLTGWDFQKPESSSYENLFELALFLKIPHNEIEELYKRMVFNLLFKNTDDHLKNHSFIYDESNNSWNLAPAYDLTLALNPFLPFTSISRALSITQKRQNIQTDDLLNFAETYTIKNPGKIISDTMEAIKRWPDLARENGLSDRLIEKTRNLLGAGG